MEFYNRIAYHDFVGIALNLDEREIIVKNLGHHKAMIMRNHGLLTLGNSIPEGLVSLGITISVIIVLESFTFLGFNTSFFILRIVIAMRNKLNCLWRRKYSRLI